MEMSLIWITGIGLVWNCIWDLWKRQVCIPVILSMSICGLVLRLWTQGEVWRSILFALIPGLVCLLLSLLFSQQIGCGDAWMVLGLGFLLEAEQLIRICMYAILCGGVAALVLLCLFRKKGSYEIPFVPFLLIGFFLDRL